ncbi:MAG: helix-turn-helix domain-containing protein [Spirochaetaceae bacterium]|nr:MAG: helix-turn-helix domain-containing protein [Spirochaetaceae bacterium]
MCFFSGMDVTSMVRSGLITHHDLSSFERLLRDACRPARIGIVAVDLRGVFRMVPDLRLSAEIQEHRCPLCVLAKSTPDGWRRCSRNKLVASTRAVRSDRAVVGMCRLGITEHIERLVVNDVPVGLFYLGQVVRTDLRAESAARLGRGAPPASRAEYESIRSRLPRVSRRAFDQTVQRVRAVLDFAAALIRAEGIPLADLGAEIIGKEWSRIREQPPIVRRALVLVSRSAGQRLSVTDLAARLRCSREYLTRAFGDAMGVSPGRYIELHRLEVARHLLSQTDLTIGEIAFRSGFSDPSHLSARFRARFGSTPTDFRRSASVTRGSTGSRSVVDLNERR